MDWEALIAQGYHCEIREEGCVYRPALHWINGHPACDVCLPQVEREPDPEPQVSAHGHKYNFPELKI